MTLNIFKNNRKKYNLVTALCMTLMVSTVTLADDTATTETCANGAGIIITGAITGHKYCRSNKLLNWFNANAWCDGINKRLFDFSDCACGNITADCANGFCPELNGVGTVYIWTATMKSNSTAWDIYMGNGKRGNGFHLNGTYDDGYALCSDF